jgi:adenylate cyclase class 2
LGTETEVKVSIHHPQQLMQRLAVIGPVLRSARHLEDNYLLDFPDGRIRSRYCVVRVRVAGEHSSVTFKGPARAEGLFKVREELESPVSDPMAVLAILDRIGLQIWFRYQKYRREYVIATPLDGEAHLALDETPIGEYLEIEGSEQAIRSVAADLGFRESEFERDSYYALYLKFCRNFDIPPGHMVFSAGSR